MTDPMHTLIEALSIAETGARTHEDIFTGPSEWTPLGRIFGGQVLAQSLIAAARTTAKDRLPHSMHGYFLRPGDAQQPLTFAVDRIHDGRSFSTRRTQAYQNGVPILSTIASFQEKGPGLDHQSEMPAGIPEPETLPSAASVLRGIDHPIARYWAEMRPFDMRHIPSPVYTTIEGERVAKQAVWFKTLGKLPDDPVIHRAALAYASDYTILESIYRRHGISWSTPGLKAASLDHAMWWHRPGRSDEWLLYLQESPSATAGRGLALGRIYNREGLLIASVAQEGMVRVPSSGDDQNEK